MRPRKPINAGIGMHESGRPEALVCLPWESFGAFGCILVHFAAFRCTSINGSC